MNDADANVKQCCLDVCGGTGDCMTDCKTKPALILGACSATNNAFDTDFNLVNGELNKFDTWQDFETALELEAAQLPFPQLLKLAALVKQYKEFAAGGKVIPDVLKAGLQAEWDRVKESIKKIEVDAHKFKPNMAVVQIVCAQYLLTFVCMYTVSHFFACHLPVKIIFLASMALAFSTPLSVVNFTAQYAFPITVASAAGLMGVTFYRKCLD